MKTVEKSITIKASPEKVFEAYTQPGHLRSWHYAQAQLALRPGGHFTFADMKGDVYECGEYRAVRTNEFLHYTFEHHGYCRDSEVEVQFSRSDDSTVVNIKHSRLNDGDWEHMNMSLDWALGNLKSYLESGRSQTFQGWFSENKKNYPNLK